MKGIPIFILFISRERKREKVKKREAYLIGVFFVFNTFFRGGGGGGGLSRYIYHSDRLHFVKSLAERDAEYQKRYKRIDYLLLTK